MKNPLSLQVDVILPKKVNESEHNQTIRSPILTWKSEITRPVWYCRQKYMSFPFSCRQTLTFQHSLMPRKSFKCGQNFIFKLFYLYIIICSSVNYTTTAVKTVSWHFKLPNTGVIASEVAVFQLGVPVSGPWYCACWLTALEHRHH